MLGFRSNSTDVQVSLLTQIFQLILAFANQAYFEVQHKTILCHVPVLTRDKHTTYH